MQMSETYILALITFCFGVISAAYGVQVGKSFEARKELLEKMREWVDEILLQLNTLYLEEILENRNAVSWEQNRLKFGVHWIRWVGIVKGLRSPRLLLATNDFISAVKGFDKRYDAIERSRDEHIKRKNDLFSLVRVVEDKAQTLHDAITQESVQIPIWLTRPYWRLRLSTKWVVVVLLFVVILLVAGIYFRII